MKSFAKILSATIFLLLSGCVSQTALNDALQQSEEKYKLQNQSLILSLGERDFDVDREQLIKALLTTFGQFNMAVLNLDSNVGFVVGEGDPPMPPEELKALGEENVAYMNEITKGGSPWRYVGNNMIIRATVNIFDRGDNFVTVKMSFSNKITTQANATSNAIASNFLEAMYKNVWAELDKQLFILQGTMGE